MDSAFLEDLFQNHPRVSRKKKDSIKKINPIKKIKEEEDLSNSKPNIHNLPPDLFFLISRNIIKLAENIGVNDSSEEERERAIRLRNSTLRALSLSCSRAFRNWYPFLMENVRATPYQLLLLYQLLNSHPEQGAMVRSLHIRDQPYQGLTRAEEGIFNETLRDVDDKYGDSVKSSDRHGKRTAELVRLAEDEAFSQLTNVETVIVSDDEWAFPVVPNIPGKRVPYPFLDTLKRIKLCSRGDKAKEYFSLRNSVWILTFCPNLTQAVLGFTVTSADYRFLQDHKEGLVGRSKVKQLAFEALFEHSKRSPRFWQESDRMTRCFHDLLLLTSCLDSLEMVVIQTQGPIVGSVNTGCLAALFDSFETLKHLRLLKVDAENNGSEESSLDLSKFKALKILAVDLMALVGLGDWNSNLIPPNLEMIQLVCYDASPVQTPSTVYREEQVLIDCIQRSRSSIPNLKTVVVPSAPIHYTGRQLSPSLHNESTWLKIRESSRNSALFADGKIKLRVLGPNELLGDETKGEICLSIFGWIQSFCF